MRWNPYQHCNHFQEFKGEKWLRQCWWVPAKRRLHPRRFLFIKVGLDMRPFLRSRLLSQLWWGKETPSRNSPCIRTRLLTAKTGIGQPSSNRGSGWRAATHHFSFILIFIYLLERQNPMKEKIDTKNDNRKWWVAGWVAGLHLKKICEDCEDRQPPCTAPTQHKTLNLMTASSSSALSYRPSPGSSQELELFIKFISVLCSYLPDASFSQWWWVRGKGYERLGKVWGGWRGAGWTNQSL